MARQRPQMPSFHAIEMTAQYLPQTVSHTVFGDANPAPRPAQETTHAPVPDEVREQTGRRAAPYSAAADGPLPHNVGRHAAYQPAHAGSYTPEVPFDGRGDHIPRHSAQAPAPGRHKAGEHKAPGLGGRVWSATKKWMMTDPDAA